MDIVIDKEIIKNIDLSEIRSYVVNMDGEFDTGAQPHKFYAYLSTLFNNTTIIEVGTGWGNSALAFSHNPNNNVISYDIEDKGAGEITKENTIFKVMDFTQDDSIDWDNVSIVMIDVDPHDAIQEPPMVQYLYDKGWSGILILDDIGEIFANMKEWFQSLGEEKWELDSEIGHYAGTGLVNFGNEHNITFTN